MTKLCAYAVVAAWTMHRLAYIVMAYIVMAYLDDAPLELIAILAQLLVNE